MTIEAPGSKSRARRFDAVRTRLSDLARALLLRRRNVDEPKGSTIVINLNPQTLSLLASAASGIIKAVPKGQLARIGLTRAPLAAPLAIAPIPAVALAAGGALVVALAVPTSRRWLVSRAVTISSAVRSKMLSRGDGSNSDKESPDETESASAVANGHAAVA